jgi:putative hemolysin
MLEFEMAILGFLILVSAFFSGSEIALFSLSRIKVRMMVKEGRRGAKSVHKLKKDPHRLLITVMLGNTLANIAAASLATFVATETFGSWGVGLATGVMTLLILVFGEITPKSLAIAHAEGLSLLAAPLLEAISYFLIPVATILESLTGGILRIFGIKKEEGSMTLTEDEIKAIVSMGAEDGVIEKGEEKLIRKVFEFNDIPVKEIMVPKEKMTCLDGDQILGECLGMLTNTPFTRIPVYRGSPDRKENFVGILYRKDVLTYTGRDEFHRKIWRIARKPPFFVDENQKVDDLLDEFQKRRIHLAIVIDDKKQVKGLVTLEDSLEELVGEIVDETDIVKPKKKKPKIEGRGRLIGSRKL